MELYLKPGKPPELPPRITLRVRTPFLPSAESRGGRIAAASRARELHDAAKTSATFSRVLLPPKAEGPLGIGRYCRSPRQTTNHDTELGILIRQCYCIRQLPPGAGVSSLQQRPQIKPCGTLGPTGLQQTTSGRQGTLESSASCLPRVGGAAAASREKRQRIWGGARPAIPGIGVPWDGFRQCCASLASVAAERARDTASTKSLLWRAGRKLLSWEGWLD